MWFLDLIEKKKVNKVLTKAEIDRFIKAYCDNELKDYQVSAMLMAIYFQGLNQDECYYLTNAMIHSGEIIDLSAIKGIKCDKHSTGGVGDKTTLVLTPWVASCGVKVAKMSGRGLGFSGGTLDKLESIPNFKVQLNQEQFIKQVNDIGIAIISQNDQLVLADKKLYALRDVSATVDSIPLIASSIMSKKIASGADKILLDVKYGEGAFMKTIDQALQLANTMIDIGTKANKDVKAMITNMNQPLGKAIGNQLEVIEAIQTLKGNGPKDLTELCLKAGSIMLLQANLVNNEQEAKKLMIEKLNDGSALAKLVELVHAQGGDESYILDPSKFDKAKYISYYEAKEDGYINNINALALAKVSLALGSGRAKKEDDIDAQVGLVVMKDLNDYVHQKDKLIEIHHNKPLNEEIKALLDECIIITKSEVKTLKLIEKVL